MSRRKAFAILCVIMGAAAVLNGLEPGGHFQNSAVRIREAHAFAHGIEDAQGKNGHYQR